LTASLDDDEIKLELVRPSPDIDALIAAQPVKLQPYYRMTCRNKLRANTTRAPQCAICAFNRVDLTDEMVQWGRENLCKSCDLVPYIRIRVSTVHKATDCPKAYYEEQVKGVEYPPTEASAHGTLFHKAEEIMINFLNAPGNVTWLRNLNGSRSELAKHIEHLIRKELVKDKECASLMLLFKELADEVIADEALLYAIRIHNDSQANGEYIAMLAKHVELSGFKPYNFGGIKLLVSGKMDKLFDVNGSWVIEDEKTRAKVTSDIGTASYEAQLGGYKAIADYMFDARAAGFGIIRLPRYFDFLVLKADPEKFEAELKNGIVKLIASGKEPTKGCGQKWCPACNPPRMKA
jgi:hypothetical protein